MEKRKELWEKAKIPEIKTIASKVKQRFRPKENEAEEPVTVDCSVEEPITIDCSVEELITINCSTIEKNLETTDKGVEIKAKFLKFLKQVKPEDIEKVEKNLEGMKRGRIIQIWRQIKALAQIIRDPQAAWTSKAVAIATLLYLITPLDAVADFIPLGLADDAALIIAVVSILASELKKYLD